MEAKMQNLKKCEEFLLKVVQKYPDQYTDISDLLQRYKNLQNSIKMLEESAKSTESQYEKIKDQYSNIEKEKTNQILLLNIDISKQQLLLEEQDNKKKEYIGQIENNIQTNFSENIIVARIFMAINNLYQRCHQTNQMIKKQKVNSNKENLEDNPNEFNYNSGKKEQSDLFDVKTSCENLNYVLNSITDLRSILKNYKPKKN